MRHLTSRVVALERANEIVEEKLSATARLERVQRVIDEELGWAVQQARREGGDRGALADVILKLAREVRQQLGLQLSISKTLVDLRVVNEFHQTVVEVIREESPDTAWFRPDQNRQSTSPSGRRHSGSYEVLRDSSTDCL
ncbi:hypothetical protein LuPra_00837 [Luteitalea pratensis]|uniref:Uncharacterized protein n=1 Tax=Luteitalea pratensis TaxID=1855912 RepID=A0A143PGL7_LUTPR|nr:hypothetical protein [Luteitalea pratensis]AMY07661.1 hypothetical protein LuPra_00837 [Luteitalea pratensis]